jgi:hypothetical protein
MHPPMLYFTEGSDSEIPRRGVRGEGVPGGRVAEVVAAENLPGSRLGRASPLAAYTRSKDQGVSKDYLEGCINEDMTTHRVWNEARTF